MTTKLFASAWSLMLVPALATGYANAAADDFSHLTGHWNFDEGRDWHNMPSPHKAEVRTVADAVKGNNLILHSGKVAPDKVWVSGRQYSAVYGIGTMKLEKPVAALNDSCTLSFWVKQAKAKATDGMAGQNQDNKWGVTTAKGNIGLVIAGKPTVFSRESIADGMWHHVVISRNANTGECVLYIDGKKDTFAKGAPGKIEGSISAFSCKDYALDQIHIFSKPVSEETVAVLYDNHAPKVYKQQQMVDRRKPTRTGSILHLYAYDPERDKLSVVDYTQPKGGSVKSHEDGTFTFTPDKGFKGKTSFSITVTDGRGGYDTAEMELVDQRHLEKPPVTEFSYAGDLPALPSQGGKKQGFRTPFVINGGDKTPDVLVQANTRLWLFRNQSKKGEIKFATPVELKTADGKVLDTDGAALLSGRRILVRRPGGAVHYAELEGKEELSIRLGKPVKDIKGADFKCPSPHFVLLDCDDDGIKDLVASHGQTINYYKGKRNRNDKDAPLSFDSEKQLIYTRSYNPAPGIGDLNGDGEPELLHGINWGTMHAWINTKGKTIKEGKYIELKLEDEPKEKYVRDLNGAHLAVDDLDGDGTPDLIMGGNAQGQLSCARGLHLERFKNNLTLIEKEIYQGHEKNLGEFLEGNNRAGLNRYRELMTGWIRWAISQSTPADREKVYNELKKHVAKYPFLQRTYLKDAWVKKDKKTGEVTYGSMHHVPGIFAMNWVVLDQLMPDSAEQRKDVADALGMTGEDRKCYLTTGIPLADNNHCTEGQLRSIADLLTYHPRILFPDDHLSIDRNFGDERDAMCYIFRSNKNTFGCDVGGSVAEMHGDMVELTNKCFNDKQAAKGDYFTFVMAHEVCHSLDNYVRTCADKELNRRWGDMNYYAATNAGKSDLVVAGENGWWNRELTQKRFQERGLWDGQKGTWDAAWKKFWENCEYRNKVFMRGNVDWFLGSQQETLATQANHHFARSESRLIGAILRYHQGYKSNINEAVLYLEFLSAGLSKIPMYHTRAYKNPNRVDYVIDYAWLERNDKGYITDVIIGERHYAFKVDESGRIIGLKSYPFAEQIEQAAKAKK